jgi:hypothetical protein
MRAWGASGATAAAASAIFRRCAMTCGKVSKRPCALRQPCGRAF